MHLVVQLKVEVLRSVSTVQLTKMANLIASQIFLQVTDTLASSFSIQPLVSNGNACFRQLREVTIVSFRVVRVVVVRGAKVVREGEKECGGVGGGGGGRRGGGRDENGPVWAATAGLGRPTTRKVPPTYANGNDARGRHRHSDRRAPLPASFAATTAAVAGRLSYALRQSRVAVCTYAPPLVRSLAAHESSETCMSLGQLIVCVFQRL